jgi:hypothetical protein
MRPAAVKLTLVVLSSGLLACARGVATPVGGADESSAPDDRPAFADGGPVADLAGGPAPDSTGILSPEKTSQVNGSARRCLNGRYRVFGRRGLWNRLSKMGRCPGDNYPLAEGCRGEGTELDRRARET